MGQGPRKLPPVLGRADLVRLGLDQSGSDRSQAEWVGFDYRPGTPSNALDIQTPQAPAMPRSVARPKAPAQTPDALPVRMTSLTLREPEAAAAQPPAAPMPVVWGKRPTVPPPFQPLATPRHVRHVLEKILDHTRFHGKPDIDHIVRRLARAEPMRAVPRKAVSTRTDTLQIIVDRSTHLTPIWEDQRWVLDEIRACFGMLHLVIWVYDEALGGLRMLTPDTPALPDPGLGPLLALSDLGTLALNPRVAWWRKLARRFAFGGGVAHALYPNPDTVARVGPWELHSWEQAPARAETAAVQGLLTFSAPAVRLEPGLLRSLRLGLFPESPVTTEIAYWQDDALSSGSAVAASFNAQKQRDRLAAFAKLAQTAPDRAAKALRLIRDWRHGGLDEIWFEEVLSLPRALRERPELVDPDDLSAADAFFSNMHFDAAETGLDRHHEAWLSRVGRRHEKARDGVWEHPHATAAIKAVLAADTGFVPPVQSGPLEPGEDRAIPLVGTLGEEAVLLGSLVARKAGVEIVDAANNTSLTMPRLVRGSDESFDLTSALSSKPKPFTVQTDRSSAFFEELLPGELPWARAVGMDDYGVFAEMQLAGGPLRFRWIPPGHGIIGPGPDESTARTAGEQQEFVLGTGFWLAERPLTWDILDRLSQIRGDYAPTAEVPHNMLAPATGMDLPESRKILTELSFLTRADMRLPTALEWEYAARAGILARTTYAVAADSEDVLVRDLKEIAWFSAQKPFVQRSGNKVHEDYGPEAVGQKRPNLWGLHDMLGNVLEMCAPQDGGDVPLKGGAFQMQPADIRFAYESYQKPYEISELVGLRPAIGTAKILNQKVLQREKQIFKEIKRAPRVHIEFSDPMNPDMNQSLPFVIGVFADLSGPQAPELASLHDYRFENVTSDSVDLLMRQIHPRLTLMIQERMAEDVVQTAQLSFRSMDDFTPDAIVDQVPFLRRWRNRRRRLANVMQRLNDPSFTRMTADLFSDEKRLVAVADLSKTARDLDVEAEDDAVFAEALMKPMMGVGIEAAPLDLIALALLAEAATFDDAPDIEDPAVLTEYLSELVENLDRRLTDAVRQIVNHDDFKTLESAWRGFVYLLEHTETGPDLKICVLNVSKAELLADLQGTGSTDYTNSGLVDLIFNDPYGTLGGEPFGLLVADYEFTPQDFNIGFVADLALECRRALVPLIAAPSPTLFGLSDWENLEESLDVALSRDLDMKRWQDIRGGDGAYIGLCAPRILARHAVAQGFRGIEGFTYLDAPTRDDLLWMSAAYPCAVNIARAQRQYGWPVQFRGVQSGGMVTNLPSVSAALGLGTDRLEARRTGPLSTPITDRQESAFATHGVMALMHRLNSNQSFFVSAASLGVQGGDDARLRSENFDILLPALRFAQAMAVMARDSMGMAETRFELGENLGQWINAYVDGSPETSAAADKARRPLAQGDVLVSSSEEPDGFGSIQLQIMPHYQILFPPEDPLTIEIPFQIN